MAEVEQFKDCKLGYTGGPLDSVNYPPAGAREILAAPSEVDALHFELERQWRAAHFDRCDYVGADGRCPHGERCDWPRPALLPEVLPRVHDGGIPWAEEVRSVRPTPEDPA